MELDGFEISEASLLSVLRQFPRLKSDRQAISVGFVGYPNVGKSSVINTLRIKTTHPATLADAWQGQRIPIQPMFHRPSIAFAKRELMVAFSN
ncbi:hypothetical protein F8388_009544 [Cannabis sativa]|uniref:G domain-containing protein n=1 Tax=Cannabis sativa TaxID=3483 RepID=A0A7J6H748_CANSA|nr:hypothetical protein F8388_009544 [Cannabis sativa]